MDNNLAEKIIERNRVSYNAAANKFSNTRHYNWPIIESLISKYIKSGDKVLDVGCGNARLFLALEKKSVDYLGIDNSENLIQLAEKTGAVLQVKDMLKIDFEQEFDAVFTLAVLNHLPSRQTQEQALKNIFQSLKPGGVFIMTNWNMWKLSTSQKTIWKYKSLTKNVKTIFDRDHPLNYYAFTLRELKSLAKKAGFEVIEAYYEKQGRVSHWWVGDNLVLVARRTV